MKVKKSTKEFFINHGPFSLTEIIKVSQTKLFNSSIDPDQVMIEDICSLDLAKANSIAVLNNPKYLKFLKKSQALACFIKAEYLKYAPTNMILLLSDNPYKSYALTANYFYPPINHPSKIDDSAVIAKSAVIGDNCYIGPNVVIEEQVVIGNNCQIIANSYIGKDVVIGDNCKIFANVSILYAVIGHDVIIHPGASIGQDGFGFASDHLSHYKIPQIGIVRIGNKVEIGANTCIDRGSINDTIIADNCMIDNLVQIAHNVEINQGSVVVSQVGISGSTKIGKQVLIGGQVGIAGHLLIEDYAQIAAKSGVIKDIKQATKQGGYPAVDIRQWHKQTTFLKQIINKDKN